MSGLLFFFVIRITIQVAKFGTISSRDRKKFICSCECLILRVDGQGRLIAPWLRNFKCFSKLMYDIAPKLKYINNTNVLVQTIKLYGPKLVLVCKVPLDGSYGKQQISMMFDMIKNQRKFFERILRQGVASDVVRNLFNNEGKKKFSISSVYIEYANHDEKQFNRFANWGGSAFIDVDSIF